MASSTQIRKFTWKDLEQFTEVFNELNSTGGPEYGFDVEFIRGILSIPSMDPERHSFVAEVHGSIAGFALVTSEPPIGRMVASGGVLKQYRNQGLGRGLLRAAVEHASSLKTTLLHVQVSRNSAPAEGLLKLEGFEPVKLFWQMEWRDDTLPPLHLADGFSLRSFRLGRDEKVLTDLQNTAFGENWGFCPNTPEQIAARVRLKHSQPEGILLVMDGIRAAGYNWTLRLPGERGTKGWISMTGVHPDYRGQGLGKTVVVAGMRYLRGERARVVELEVDSENVPARELYLSLGFRKARETVWYERRL